MSTEEELQAYWKDAECKYYDEKDGYCKHDEAIWAWCDYSSNIRACILSSKKGGGRRD